MSGAARRRLLQVLGGALLAGWFLAFNLANLEFAAPDNGDFTRFVEGWVVKPQGFAVNWPEPVDPEWQRRFFRCWHRFWDYRSAPDPAMTSADAGTSRFLWGLAFQLDRALTRDAVFDLQILGAILRAAALLLVLLFYALAARCLRGRSWVLPVLVALPVAASLSDPRQTTFFNTFYREGGTLLFALLTTCGLLALGGRRFWAAVAVAAVGSVLLAGSATHHFFTAPLAAVALLLAFWRWRRRQKATAGGLGGVEDGVAWLALAAVLVVLVALGVRNVQRPAGLHRVNAYQALFTGALMASDDPAGHLALLGFPPESRALVGQHAFTPGAERFLRDHPQLAGFRATAAVLRREPRVAARLLRRGGEGLAGAEGLLWLASDERCAARQPRLAVWTAARNRLLPGGYPLFGLLAAAAGAGLLAVRREDPRLIAVGLALAFTSLAAAGEIAVAVFGDGIVVDFSRHLLAAGFFVDLTLALLLWLAALAWTRRRGSAAP